MGQAVPRVFVMPMRGDPIVAEIAAGCRRARILSGLGLDDFCREVSRVMGRAVGVAHYLSIENEEIDPCASLLIAAARVAEQPLSVILGETDLYAITMPELERQVKELQQLIYSSKSTGSE